VECGPDHRPKTPLKPKQVWVIRQHLKNAGKTRDLALFPAWLVHGVRPHGGPRGRISVALNLSV